MLNSKFQSCNKCIVHNIIIIVNKTSDFLLACVV